MSLLLHEHIIKESNLSTSFDFNIYLNASILLYSLFSRTGAIFAWGRNTFGQLGLNDTEQRNVPYQLRTLRNAKVCYAACGEEFSVFLTLVNFLII